MRDQDNGSVASVDDDIGSDGSFQLDDSYVGSGEARSDSCAGSVASVDDDIGSDGAFQLDDAYVGSGEARSDSCAGKLHIMLDASEEDDSDENPLNTELLTDKEDALNIARDGENADEYGAMDSGDDAAKDDLETGGDDDGEHTDFTTVWGCENEVVAGKLKNDVLRDMSASGGEDAGKPDIYYYMMTPYEPHVAICSNEYCRGMVSLRVDDAYKRCRNKRCLNTHS
ncbi:Hypothetical protein PHPALM_1420 [Phytophthora palmivora]|uniref:Uncharacterized protein n=1 Tax=Phytophthora palmivora TaxID=4796 RepID=A0A2P4YSD3_9STRA|nr:Hypothetical protein PHPALM_1420 [Phytophthora palmivora]